MSLHSVPPVSLDFLASRPVEIEVSSSPLSSDAGLLLIRQFDERIHLTEQFAAALQDTRNPSLARQSIATMVRQRIFGILADYEDQNDHDTLRSDPVFKLLAGRLPDGLDLASQPTLSRFENAVSIADLWRLRDVMVDLFIQSFDRPPNHLTFDIDAFDDPAHGQQQLTMFHGYYEQNQYLPIAITCAENDMVLLVGLRYGTCAAFLGANNDLRYLVGRLRAVWPDVQIHVRGDSGFGVPLMYDVCQELRLSYTLGIGMNSRLRAMSDALLKDALQQYEETGQPQRLFLCVEYQADSWLAPQPVVIKVEVHAQGTNRRAVVTNRPGCRVLPQAIYDEYTMRGESENRNKELKTELLADRLSDHRFMANYFRLYLHTAALNLLVRLRQAVVQTLPTSAELNLPADFPTEAIDEPNRKRFFNKRRERDPLGGGFASTWRTRLIKVSAEVITRARRVIVRLSSSWPHIDHFMEVSRAVNMPPPQPSPG
ncbi:IS1380 family transposase [Singulisphaera sp. Ch08]|uniref:IS1380 family transposase n=1 Tax=Singulisphaera sp. Ch08 TaxID=3120278 RepID=A0AAU7CSE4_9BACT